MLLDENMPDRLRELFDRSVEVVTVGYRGWQGKKNGELLRSAQGVFDAFVTADQGIPHQRNPRDLEIGIVVLEASSNRYEDLAPLMDQVNAVLKTLRYGQIVRIGI